MTDLENLKQTNQYIKKILEKDLELSFNKPFFKVIAEKFGISQKKAKKIIKARKRELFETLKGPETTPQNFEWRDSREIEK